MTYNVIRQTEEGYLLYNPNDTYVGRSVEHYGDYQREELKFFSDYVKPGDTVLDIGANIGTHTLWFANRVGSKDEGRVLAFEPQRLVYQTLCANMALNSVVCVDCKHMGVGSAQKIVKVPILDPDVENNFGGLSIKEQDQGEDVAVVPIDHINLSRCDFIKIDVEGMEPEVLMGGLKTIYNHKPVIYMEVDRGENTPLVAEIMDSLGYEMNMHTPPLHSPDYEQENIFGETVSINAICTPRH
jgi:FkbM family methyltransferase